MHTYKATPSNRATLWAKHTQTISSANFSSHVDEVEMKTWRKWWLTKPGKNLFLQHSCVCASSGAQVDGMSASLGEDSPEVSYPGHMANTEMI